MKDNDSDFVRNKLTLCFSILQNIANDKHVDKKLTIIALKDVQSIIEHFDRRAQQLDDYSLER